MKKFMYFAAALLVLVGCNKNDNIVENAPEGTPFEKGQKVTLTIGTGAQQGPNKVAGKDNTETNEIDFVWEEGDQILVKVGDATAEFTLISAPGSADGEFAGEMPAGGSTFDIQYPITTPDLTAQEYTEEADPIPADKMLFTATGCVLGTNAILAAQHAMVQFNLYGTDMTVGKIVFRNKTGVDVPAYTLTLPEGGVEIGANSEEATPFYMVVPTGSYKFEVEVYNNAATPAKICSFATSAESNFIAGNCLNMPAKEVKIVVEWTKDMVKTIVIETGVDVSSYKESGTLRPLNDEKTLWELFDESTETLHIQSSESQINISLEGLFSGYEHVQTITGLGKIHATTAKSMFQNCHDLTTFDISNLNTEDITDMSYMFDGCEALESLNLSNFNTAKVTDMSYMFHNCKKITTLDFSGFNTEKVTDMSHMFAGCSWLLDHDLSGFNTANVTDMSYMFQGCGCIHYLNLAGFNTANVTDMTSMFGYCAVFYELTLSNNFKVASSKTNMFSGCPFDDETGGCVVKGVTDDGIKEALRNDTGWNEEYIYFEGEW